ncbi:hypothetical protein IGK47_000764 [Enterococcus sp. AZ007]
MTYDQRLENRDALVKKEKNRLNRLFKEIPEKKKKAVEGLVVQAARLRVLLDEMWIDISENGDYELFSQSENQVPYERERPIAKLYNARDTSYQRVMKQLTDLIEVAPSNDGKPPPAQDGSDLL